MDECPICFSSNWLSKTPCNHSLCLNCLIQLRKDECPCCRQPLFYSLPLEMKRIVSMIKRRHSRNININDYDQFPALN